MPALPAGVFGVSLEPRHPPDPAANLLTVSLPGIRRMHIFLQVSTDTRLESNDIWWWLAASATLVTPFTPQVTQVNLAPALLDIAPLTAPIMHVATAFWPAEPAVSSMSVKFSTPADIPQGWGSAFGIGDTTPHDRSGIFATPYGYTRQPRRLVEPLVDPDMKLGELKVIDALQIMDRLPPPRLPLVRRTR